MRGVYAKIRDLDNIVENIEDVDPELAPPPPELSYVPVGPGCDIGAIYNPDNGSFSMPPAVPPTPEELDALSNEILATPFAKVLARVLRDLHWRCNAAGQASAEPTLAAATTDQELNAAYKQLVEDIISGN